MSAARCAVAGDQRRFLERLRILRHVPLETGDSGIFDGEARLVGGLDEALAIVDAEPGHQPARRGERRKIGRFRKSAREVAHDHVAVASVDHRARPVHVDPGVARLVVVEPGENPANVVEGVRRRVSGGKVPESEFQAQVIERHRRITLDARRADIPIDAGIVQGQHRPRFGARLGDGRRCVVRLGRRRGGRGRGAGKQRQTGRRHDGGPAHHASDCRRTSAKRFRSSGFEM